MCLPYRCHLKILKAWSNRYCYKLTAFSHAAI